MTIASAAASSTPAPPAKTVTAQLYETVQSVPEAQRRHLAEVGSRDLTPGERLRAAREFDAKVLDVAEAGFKQLAADHEAAYQQGIANLTANVDESSAARIRDRAFDRLSRADSPLSAAQALIETASTPQELGVVLQEVPSWLEARGHPASWVPEVLATVRPDVAEAASKRHKANQARDLGLTTIAQVWRGIDSACPAAHLMKPEEVRKYDPDVQ